MRKIIICAFILGAAFASPAAARVFNPEFWAQISDRGKRISVFAANPIDKTFRCNLTVPWENADGSTGSFVCRAKVSGKAREALVCSGKIDGPAVSVGRIKQFCQMH